VKVYNSEYGSTILSWCNNPEQSALAQAFNLAKHPFIDDPVCLMPDTHCGYGMPIGGVISVDGAVIPNAVGVDIGCGMLAVKTSLTEIDTEKLKSVMSIIRGAVPVGFSHHQKPHEDKMPDTVFEETPIVKREYDSATHQVGTLGGGNHFIELQSGSDGHIWFMLHSGSRNIGLKVAKHYNNLAVELNERWASEVDAKDELAFLPIDTPEADKYIAEMKYCLAFALSNRTFMSEMIEKAMHDVTGCSFDPAINIHHNYAAIENHRGKNRWVHRKGATSARLGEIGIIPGSQGTSSYIVEGLGNDKSYRSCSHGAGRKMGRKEAVRTLSMEDEVRAMNERGILHSVRTSDDLDEAPGSYKDIDVVMAEQTDLVKILVKLSPLGCIKG
jgi:tRNA-splicing ligase RtcB